MFLCVCLRELDRGKEQEKAPTSRGRGFTRLRPKHFQSWPGGHFSDLRIVKMPIKATSVCQSWSQNTRSVQLKNTGCTRYKPNALFTPADGMPALKTHLSFSGNIFRVLNCFDLVVPVFLWSLDYFYLWTPSMGTAAWKRQPCITFTLLRDKAKKKKKWRWLIPGVCYSQLFLLLMDAHCTNFRLMDQAAWESACYGSAKQTDSSV